MRMLLHFLKPYKLQTFAVLAALAVNLLGVLLVPTILANMINIGVSSRDFDYIVHQALFMLTAAVLSGAGAFVSNYFCADLATKVGRDIRNAVYEASLKFSGGDFERFGTGSMITRTLGDVNVIQQAITMTIQMMLPVPFAAVIGVALAWSIDEQMGMMLACFIIVVAIIAVVTVKKAAVIFQKLQRFIDRMNVRLRESITGARVIRAFGKEEAERKSLDEAFSAYADSAIKVNWLFATFDCSSFFIMNLAEVAVIWLGGNRVGAHAMQIASISACVEYAMLILFFLMMAQICALTLPRALVCLERCRQVIECPPSIADGPGTELTPAQDIVAHFGNASFRFADASEDTLHHINFFCRRGTTTAIIGPTGSGKSTIAKLLLRFHDVSDGAVEVCGTDVRDLTQRALRTRISYVPQKAWLFSGTIAENLRYGKPDATDEELWHALDVAQSGFVRELPDGLETCVAQGGTNFSGGQRQRLSIARALVKPADLYIFDDSFSALDFKTDAALRHALATEVAHAAVLIIAQRINTIVSADQIIVLKDGCIQGLGTHRELMRSCAAYQEIARSQLRAEELEELLGVDVELEADEVDAADAVNAADEVTVATEGGAAVAHADVHAAAAATDAPAAAPAEGGAPATEAPAVKGGE
ncbi:ABC transporter ATP-binding protein [[Collinsella] massiliensis]|uniref:Multidrug ABC transporter ATP-binding protein n=1 Tax=[Collinsella] massiliensis TaxID=1232426 RepID=A0A1Y3Y0V5_9ACTN|nr:ABC transporter ATP-binding protein [[Collinsella] massiliensis]OUN87940.1 multidrug ABC transporter ATP-binding protein [[Collinsella] massiliensis]